MRAILLCLLGAFWGVAAANDDDVLKQGSIYAVVLAHADGDLSFVEPPRGGLPESVLTQLEPTFLSRAREAHVGTSDETEYHVGIDWKLVKNGDKEQLHFDYKNSDPMPLVLVEPAFPRIAMIPDESVKVILQLIVNPDGSVDDVVSGGGNPRREFFENARIAVREWKFSPKYENGIAVAHTVQLPIEFLMPDEADDDADKGNILAHFFLDESGDVERLRIEGDIPPCHDADRIQEEIKDVIRASEAAVAVRRGVTRHREGHVTYEVPSCSTPTGEVAK